MKLTSLVALSLAAVASAASLSKRALLDIAQTRAQVSANRQELDQGLATVHILRTDDLLSDSHQVIAERLSHIVLEIQLEPAQSAVRINDELIPIDGDGDVAVAIVKSDAFMLNSDVAALASEEQVQALAASMSPGIVSLEVRVESETVPAGAVLTDDAQDGELRAMVVDGLRLRRVGIFVKINEVEGLDVAHSSLVYAPILQLLVTSGSASGDRITQIKTLSVAGQQPVDVAPVSPGPVMMNDLPPYEEAAKHLPEDFQPVPDADDLPEGESEHGFPSATRLGPHRHPVVVTQPLSPPGLIGWMARMFGLKGSSGKQAPHTRRPCLDRHRKGLAAAAADRQRGQTADNVFAEKAVSIEKALYIAYGDGPISPDDPSARHPPHGHPHRHGKGRRRGFCIFRRMMRTARFVFFSMMSTTAGQICFGFLSGAVAFSLTRRIVHLFRPRTIPAYEPLNDDEEVEKKIADGMVYVDELPAYSEKPVVVIVEAEPARL